MAHNKKKSDSIALKSKNEHLKPSKLKETFKVFVQSENSLDGQRCRINALYNIRPYNLKNVLTVRNA